MQVLLSPKSRTGISSILVLLYLLRLAIPYGNYLFLPFEILSAVVAIVFLFNKKIVGNSVKEYVNIYAFPLVVLLVLVGYYLFTSNLHRTLSIDVIHSINSFVVVFILSVLLRSEDELLTSLKDLKKLIIISGAVVAILGILKLVLQLMEVGLFNDESKFAPLSSSITLDTNFFSLFLLLSIILTVIELFGNCSKKRSLILQGVLLLITICIALSVSRRATIGLCAIVGFVILLFFLSFFVDKQKLKIYQKNISVYVFSFLGVGVLFAFFLFILSPQIRNRMIQDSPFGSLMTTYLSSLVYKAESIIKEDVSYIDVKDKLTAMNFDARYPSSGWASGNYTLVKNIKGENAEIVPNGAEGCLVDKNTKSTIWEGGSYYSLIPFKGKAAHNTNYFATAYYYVSEDFNGDGVSLSSRTEGGQFIFYDLKDKGKWKKIETYFRGYGQDYQIWLQIEKKNTLSFDSLQGYVIFAYPEIDSLQFNPKNPKSWVQKDFKAVVQLQGENVEIVPEGSIGLMVDKESKPATANSFYSSLFNFQTQPERWYENSIYCYVSPEYNGEYVRLFSMGIVGDYNLSRKGSWQKLVTRNQGNGKLAKSSLYFELPEGLTMQELQGHVIFAYPVLDSLVFSPRNPKTWSQKNFKEMYPIEGQNAEIVPDSSIGLVVNRESKSSTSNSFFSQIFKFPTVEGKRYEASIYCFVSPEYNGEYVKLISGGREIDYNIENKGVWQKLVIRSQGNGKIARTSVYFELQKNLKIADDMSGYVVFAYPEIDSVQFNPKIPRSWTQKNYKEMYPLVGENVSIVPDSTIGLLIDKGINLSKSKSFYSNVFRTPTEIDLTYEASIYCYVSPEYNGKSVKLIIDGKETDYNLNKVGTWQKLVARCVGSGKTVNTNLYFELPEGKGEKGIEGYVVFAYPKIDTVLFDVEKPNTWTQKDYSEMYPLEGDGVYMVPRGIVGLKVDDDNQLTSLKRFFNNILKFPTQPDKRYEASIYCYVSPDFNGDKVKLISIGEEADYNLGKKGEWQKLVSRRLGNGKVASTNIYFELPEDKNKDKPKLKGYVVFAYPKLDSMVFNPMYVRSFAPNNNFSIVDKLEGDNVDILPAHCQGIYFDSTANGNIWKYLYYTSHAFCSANTEEGDSIKASIYCYQSKDFNGRSRVEAIGYKSRKYYNEKERGKWQKLETIIKSKGGHIRLGMFYSLNKAIDYSELTGHVVFAYPQLSIKRNGIWLPYCSYVLSDTFEEKSDVSQVADDKIKTKVEADDAAEVIPFEMSKNIFFGPRINRWRYAWLLFSDEYSVKQKIFGGGFAYTEKFAKLFNVPHGFDYPHNPMLSVLLYSGIFGLVLYFGMLFLVFKYYWKYTKQYWPWVLCFIMTFFFSFFSANGPFEPSVMGFFLLLPFLIHLISTRSDVKYSEINNS